MPCNYPSFASYDKKEDLLTLELDAVKRIEDDLRGRLVCLPESSSVQDLVHKFHLRVVEDEATSVGDE